MKSYSLILLDCDNSYKLTPIYFLPGGFKLTIDTGDFSDSEIIVMLGENGTGKTTFIKMLAGITKPTTTGEILLQNEYMFSFVFEGVDEY